MKNKIILQIKVPSQTRYLSLIGRIGENVAREMCRLPSDKETFAHDLNVVLTEAMANAIKHASAGEPDTFVKISITISDKVLSVMVYDSGRGFDLNSIPNPVFESDCLDDAGRGIFIIRSLMDTVEYRKTSVGNVLEMRKVLR